MKSILTMVAVVSTLCAFAQDDDFDFDDAGDQAVEAAGEDGEVAADDDAAAEDGDELGEPKKKKDLSRLFKTLPFCLRLEGRGEVLTPGAKDWAPVEEGKFYALGSSFRTTDDLSRLKVGFGDVEEISVEIDHFAGSFGTRFQPLGEKTRTVTLQSGKMQVKLPRNMPEGTFTISAPGFEVKNPKGISRYYYNRTVDGDVAQIRCHTGSLSIEGRNFVFPEIKIACEVKIRTSQDQLFTGLYGTRGDSLVRLDQGQRLVTDYATGEVLTEQVPLEWKLSPKTAVRIHRAVPAIGERLSVTVMTFDANGSLQNRCAFTEGRPEVNTGELGPVAQASVEEAAKKAAAEASEVEAVEADADDDSASSDDAGAASDDAAETEDTLDDDFEF